MKYKIISLFCTCSIIFISVNISKADTIQADTIRQENAQAEAINQTNNQNDVWLFNTRTASICSPNESEFDKIFAYQLGREADNRCYKWEKAAISDFFETYDPSVPLIVLIHGNQYALNDAVDDGLAFEQRVLKGQKCRLLIWAWPADRIPCGIRADVQTKIEYSKYQGAYVQMLLDRLPEKGNICLVGFSLGAQTICEAVELTYKSNNASSSEKDNEPKIRIILFAAAVDQFSVSPKCRYGDVLEFAEKTCVVYNPADKVLKFYPLVYGRGGPESLGKTGVPLYTVPSSVREKIDMINISQIAGNRHHFKSYFGSKRINQYYTDFVLFRQ
ncbi:MAG: alpha/beta hydrolase [Thermoguttaceae bacterium]